MTPTPWLTPYEQGAEAFHAGRTLSDNPHAVDPHDWHDSRQRHLSWHNGWRRAEYEETDPPYA